MADETKKKTAANKKSTAAKTTAVKQTKTRAASAHTAARASATSSRPANERTAAAKRTRTANVKPAQPKTAQNKGRAACKSTVEAQRDCRLTDYDIISDILGSHKSLIKLYGTALCEIASEDLRDIVSCQMAECAEDQFDAFNYMSARGMYPTEPAPVQKVKQARQKFSGSIKK